MKTTSMSRIWLRAWLSVTTLLRDQSGIAATEFAVIVPIMSIFRADEVRYIVGHSGAVALVGPETFNRFDHVL